MSRLYFWGDLSRLGLPDPESIPQIKPKLPSQHLLSVDIFANLVENFVSETSPFEEQSDVMGTSSKQIDGKEKEMDRMEQLLKPGVVEVSNAKNGSKRNKSDGVKMESLVVNGLNPLNSECKDVFSDHLDKVDDKSVCGCIVMATDSVTEDLNGLKTIASPVNSKDNETPDYKNQKSPVSSFILVFVIAVCFKTSRNLFSKNCFIKCN